MQSAHQTSGQPRHERMCWRALMAALGCSLVFGATSPGTAAGVGQTASTLLETIHGGGPVDTVTFGRILAIHDRTMVVASRPADSHEWVAHVYQRSPDGWNFLTQLTPPLGATETYFDDISLAVSADAVFIGDPEQSGGPGVDLAAVHVFDWIEGWPTYQTSLYSPNPGSDDMFGAELDAENDVIVVGAPESGPGRQGAVFVFRRSESGWKLESTLTAPTPMAGRFGASIELAGDTLFVGAPWETISSGLTKDDNWAAGAVHVFKLVRGRWEWQQQLTAEVAMQGAEFGNAIACDGELAVIGAWKEPDLGPDGAAYVFGLQDNTWQMLWHGHNDTYLLPGFGTAVDVQNGHVLVGAPGNGGHCILYSPSKGDWVASGMLSVDGDADAKFGCAVAFDGEEVLVGARAQSIPGSMDEGAVYAYRHNLDDSVCEPFASGVMQPADLVPGDFFGALTACDDERVIVLVPSQGFAGAAYIFRRFGSTWVQEFKLFSPEPSVASIGSSVAIQGSYAAVGVQGALTYVYKKVPGGGWLFDQTVLPEVPAASGAFGASIALSDDLRLFVGAPEELNPDGFKGAVYVFELVNDDWVQADRLTTTGLLPGGGRFGESIVVDGDWLAISAPFAFHEEESAGAVCLFKRTDEGWIEQQKIFSPNPFQQAHFGSDIDLAGNTLVATGTGCGVSMHSYDGDHWSEGTVLVPSLCLGGALDCSLTEDMLLVGSSLSGLGMDSASVFAFRRQGGEWIQRGRIDTPLTQIGGGQFATTLTHNDEWVVIAAPWADAILTDPKVQSVGAVFAYEIPDDCDKDCNESGLSDSGDISSGASEDCNGNGVPDECDLANQSSTDCNDDGVPDECQDALVSFDSTAFTPLLAGINHSVLITSPPPPIGDVILSFSASGDLAFSSENIVVDLNGTPLGVLWGTFISGGDCSNPPLTATIVVPRAAWQAAVGAGDAKITMTPSAGVDSAACTDGSFISWTTSYTALVGLDRDSDGVIDSCSGAKTAPEDLDGDGQVDGFDLAILLAQWGRCPKPGVCPADLDGNGIVNGLDLAMLLGAWT